MKKKQKRTVVSGPWDIAALVMAGLLALNLLCMLVLLLAGAGMMSLLECGMSLGVLLLVGMGVYFLGKARELERLPRLALLGTLAAGGLLLGLLGLALAALLLFSGNS